MSLRDTQTGTVYSDADIARMRDVLARDTGLDLAGMSDKSVVANYFARKSSEEEQ